MERPAFIEKMEQHDQDFGEQIRGLSNMVMTDGAIPAKVKMLMALLGEAVLHREEGVRILAAVARNVGATQAEINETIRLAFLLGGLPALSVATKAYAD